MCIKFSHCRVLTDGRDQKRVTSWVCSSGERLREQVVIVSWDELETSQNCWEEHLAQGCAMEQVLRVAMALDLGRHGIEASGLCKPELTILESSSPWRAIDALDFLLTHAQLTPCCLAFSACPGLPWAADPAPHLAGLLECGWSEASMSTGVCIIGGESGMRGLQPPDTWCFSSQDSPPSPLDPSR